MLIMRMNGIIDWLRSLNAIADDNLTRAHLKADLTGCGPDPPSSLRPRADGRGVPVWVILVGTLGRLLEHGLLGLFVGPIVVSLGYRLFQVWIVPTAQPPEPGQQRQALTHSIEWSRDGGPR